MNGHQCQSGTPEESGGPSYRKVNPDGSSVEVNCGSGQSMEVNTSTGSASCK
ncbi:hypothetical protein [Shewanella piezotolerans]|uniref:hypothetical protein n=1 Tax=Shewanella piezotolerans TaxID=404011 RepID=UPI00164F43AD|nr:hypothetical protein [Shewanella piezotolerans]